MYNHMLNLLQTNFSHRSVEEKDMTWVSALLNKANAILILKDILNQPELLQRIEDRSYTHALGFDKIILADLSKDIDKSLPKAQIRLHLWDPKNTAALPIVESLHEHSFDFISTVLTGYLENQQYSFKHTLSHEEKQLLNHLLMWRELSSDEEVKEVDRHIEIIEARRLELYESSQFDAMYHDEDVSRSVDYAAQKTGFSKNQVIDILLNLQGHYVSNRVPGDKKAYKHILSKYVSIKPHNVLSIHAGEHYYHPYTLPHRLFYDNKMFNSTLLLTTPVASNAEGGSLQRPTYVKNNEQNYSKISYKKGELANKLISYLKLLEAS